MGVEIVSGVERRRRWSAEAKLRVMSEALAPGASISAVADRNGVCRSQLYHWLRLARDGELPGITLAVPVAVERPLAAASFVPVKVEPAPSPSRADTPAPRSVSAPTACAAAAPHRRTTSVEVVLGNGRTLKVDESIDPAVLARLAAALDEGARLRPDGVCS